MNKTCLYCRNWAPLPPDLTRGDYGWGRCEAAGVETEMMEDDAMRIEFYATKQDSTCTCWEKLDSGG